ncbi:hypothetical protein RJ639_003157 [Escallonia herrerae]|uniref:protein-serine/threonine phosphatase n=1 Tax=Escallonia herrerae TaxID=1293975 RepID=A0AA88W222_9ASTE|nr:hypothetical protein RJ639_003157 [Escallonia herrerae]
MEDYYVSEYKNIKGHVLGLFAIFDGHLGVHVPSYLKDSLFGTILEEVCSHLLFFQNSLFDQPYSASSNMIQPNFWNNPEMAIRNAYRSTDKFILENSMKLGRGGSTAVTAIVLDGKDLWVANIGDSRAVLCERGSASQLTVDHEPHSERRRIEKQGGFVTTLPGDVPRVNGQLAVARAFGDQSLKAHLSSEPDIRHVPIDSTMEFVILARHAVPWNWEVAWVVQSNIVIAKDQMKVMNNQDAVDVVKSVKDPQAAAKRLTTEALARKSKDDIVANDDDTLVAVILLVVVGMMAVYHHHMTQMTMVGKLVGGDCGVALPVAMDQLMPPGLQLVGNILLLVMELELLTGGVDMVVLHNIEEVAASPVLVMEAVSCVDNK